MCDISNFDLRVPLQCEHLLTSGQFATDWGIHFHYCCLVLYLLTKIYLQKLYLQEYGSPSILRNAFRVPYLKM